VAAYICDHEFRPKMEGRVEETTKCLSITYPTENKKDKRQKDKFV